MNTYYETLGLEPGASQLEIKKAYFKMVRQHSPESDPEQFQKIREAYEQLKAAGDEPKGPTFPPLSDPLASKMLEQIESSRRLGNKELYRDTSEEAWRRFPENIQFLYHLIIAQRKCGNTGKAVKNAELLVKKDPENKWFQRELAISYIERGFTQKAYLACEKAYELGCRDLDFILMYSIECNEYGNYDQGIKILLDVIHQEKKWSKEETPELVETYIGLFSMNYYGNRTHFLEILESLCQNLNQYGIYMADHVFELSTTLSNICANKTYTAEEYQKAEQAFALLQNICRTEQEKFFVNVNRDELLYQRIFNDPRISETLKIGLEVYYVFDDSDSILKKFAETDMWLCMIEERTEVLQQAEIIQQDYPDFYEKIEDFIQKLKSGKNLSFLKESLLKTYRRIEPMCGGGLYYEKYPQEKKKALGTLINEGLTDEPYYRSEKKIGRNDPCPCGSGKKYKHCCMNK